MLYRKYPNAVRFTNCPHADRHGTSLDYYSRVNVGFHKDNLGYIVVVVTKAKNAKFRIRLDDTVTVSLSTGDIIVFDSDRYHACEGSIDFLNMYPTIRRGERLTEEEANTVVLRYLMEEQMENGTAWGLTGS